jgi:hypothetical protein
MSPLSHVILSGYCEITTCNATIPLYSKVRNAESRLLQILGHVSLQSNGSVLVSGNRMLEVHTLVHKPFLAPNPDME